MQRVPSKEFQPLHLLSKEGPSVCSVEEVGEHRHLTDLYLSPQPQGPCQPL